jgi:hypothetical protein
MMVGQRNSLGDSSPPPYSLAPWRPAKNQQQTNSVPRYRIGLKPDENIVKCRPLRHRLRVPRPLRKRCISGPFYAQSLRSVRATSNPQGRGSNPRGRNNLRRFSVSAPVVRIDNSARKTRVIVDLILRLTAPFGEQRSFSPSGIAGRNSHQCERHARESSSFRS